MPLPDQRTLRRSCGDLPAARRHCATDKRVLALADDHRITVADLITGEVLSVHLIEPNKTYWRNQNKQLRRWPSSPK